MSYYRRPPQRLERRRQGGPRRLLVGLVLMIWVVLGAVLGYQYLVREQVSREIGRQISEQLGGSAPATTDRPGAPGDTAAGAAGRAGGALPTLVAALPVGEIRVSEAQANAYLAEHAAELQPIERATIRFVPGEIQAELTALGASSTARMGAAIQDGRVVVVNPQIDGPLAALVDLNDLVTPLEQQLNAELGAQQRRISGLRIEQGELVFLAE